MSKSSFRFDIEPNEQAALDFISEVHELLATAYKFRAEDGLTKAEVARRLDTNKSWVTRLLGEPSNITLETLAKVADALEFEPQLKLHPHEQGHFSQPNIHWNSNVENQVYEYGGQTTGSDFMPRNTLREWEFRTCNNRVVD